MCWLFACLTSVVTSSCNRQRERPRGGRPTAVVSLNVKLDILLNGGNQLLHELCGSGHHLSRHWVARQIFDRCLAEHEACWREDVAPGLARRWRSWPLPLPWPNYRRYGGTGGKQGTDLGIKRCIRMLPNNGCAGEVAIPSRQVLVGGEQIETVRHRDFDHDPEDFSCVDRLRVNSQFAEEVQGLQVVP